MFRTTVESRIEWMTKISWLLCFFGCGSQFFPVCSGGLLPWEGLGSDHWSRDKSEKRGNIPWRFAESTHQHSANDAHPTYVLVDRTATICSGHEMDAWTDGYTESAQH